MSASSWFSFAMNSSSKSKSSELSGARDPMVHGLGANAKADLGSALGSAHPLETSEREYEQTEQGRQLENLRQMQGLHAPLRIHMERNALSKVRSNAKNISEYLPGCRCH